MVWTNGIEPMPAIQMRLASGLSILTKEFGKLRHPSDEHWPNLTPFSGPTDIVSAASKAAQAAAAAATEHSQSNKAYEKLSVP